MTTSYLQWRSKISQFLCKYQKNKLPANLMYRWAQLGKETGFILKDLSKIVTAMQSKSIPDGPVLVELDEMMKQATIPKVFHEATEEELQRRESDEYRTKFSSTLEKMSEFVKSRKRIQEATRKRLRRQNETKEEGCVRRRKNSDRMARFRNGPDRENQTEENSGKRETKEQASERRRKDAEQKRNSRKKRSQEERAEDSRLDWIRRKEHSERQHRELSLKLSSFMELDGPKSLEFNYYISWGGSIGKVVRVHKETKDSEVLYQLGQNKQDK